MKFRSSWAGILGRATCQNRFASPSLKRPQFSARIHAYRIFDFCTCGNDRSESIWFVGRTVAERPLLAHCGRPSWRLRIWQSARQRQTPAGAVRRIRSTRALGLAEMRRAADRFSRDVGRALHVEDLHRTPDGLGEWVAAALPPGFCVVPIPGRLLTRRRMESWQTGRNDPLMLPPAGTPRLGRDRIAYALARRRAGAGRGAEAGRGKDRGRNPRQDV